MTANAAKVFKQVAESIAALPNGAARRPVVYRKLGSSHFSVLVGRAGGAKNLPLRELPKKVPAKH